MAFILQQDPIPAVGEIITFRVDDNSWAAPGQSVIVSYANGTVLGYFIVSIVTIVQPNIFYISCINDAVYTSYNPPPTTPVPIGSYIGPGQPPGIGTQGPAGPQGPTVGPQGPQGNEGTQGFQGNQGPQGTQGNQGNEGPQGFQGNQGSQGPQGFQGNDGPQGFQGNDGPQGNEGSQGFQGPQGSQGFQGPQGFQGNDGPQGNDGSQGFQGPGINISNFTDDRVLTSDGTPNGANAEENLLFDGSLLTVIGDSIIGNSPTNAHTFSGNLYVNQNLIIFGTFSASGLNYPIVDGSPNQVLYTDGSGTLGWTNSGGGGGGGSQGYQGFQGLGETGPQGFQGIDGTQGYQGYQGSTGSANLEKVGEVTWDLTGFVNRTDSILSFSSSTREFTISPNPGTYTVWYRGEELNINTPLTITISNTSGGRYIALNPDTMILEDIGPIPSILEDLLVSYIYWDSSNSEAVIFGDERHAAHRDTQWHISQHLDVGAVWRQGGNLTYTLNDDTEVTLGVSNIEIADEDLIHDIINDPSPSNPYEQVLSPTASIPVIYLLGTTYVQTTPSTVPWVPGTSRASYNPIVGGVGSLADANSGEYIGYWLLATNDSVYPVKLLMGRFSHGTIRNALDETLDGYGLPFPEIVPLYRIILRTRNVLTGNPAKVEIIDVQTIITRQSGAFFYSLNVGPIGPQGSQGSQGLTGPQGSQGVQGFQGLTGSQGPQGVQGFQGLTGTQGDIGPQGNIGVTGVTGPTGPAASLSPGNYVAKGVKGGSAQTIPGGVDTVVTFIDDFDPQNWLSSNKFQPTVSGYYVINAQVWWDAGSVTNNQTNIQFRKNGTTQISIHQTQILTGAGYAQELDTIEYFNGTTDYIEVTAYTGNTTSQNINGASSGTWITAALQTVGIGSQGATGVGSTGPTGSLGSTGPTGPPGFTGDVGPQGPTGPSGETAVVTLTDGPTIDTDVSLGNLFTITLGGNRVLNNPLNPTNGKRVIWRVKQDSTGGRILSLDSDFRFGTDITSIVLSTAPDVTDYFGAIYNSNDNKWDVIAFVKGFA